MSDFTSLKDIRSHLRSIGRRERGNVAELARQLKVSAPMLSQVISGDRGARALSPKLLKALGYDPNPYYKKIAQ